MNFEFNNISLKKELNAYIFKSTSKDNYLLIKSDKQYQFNLNWSDGNIVIISNNKEYRYDKQPLQGLTVNIPFPIKIIIQTSIKLYITKIIKIPKQLYTPEMTNILIINLKSRQDRKQKIIEMFNKYNINNYKFIEGIIGKDLQEEFNKLKDKTNIINTGHYGCLLSHIKAIEYAKNNNYKNVLILEDDIVINNNFVEEIGKLLLPKFDMLYLGGISSRAKLYKYARANKIMGAYSYLINNNMYDKILEILKTKRDYVDLQYLTNIQKTYNVYILADIIKTNIDTTDTAQKSRKYIERIEYINNINLPLC